MEAVKQNGCALKHASLYICFFSKFRNNLNMQFYSQIHKLDLTWIGIFWALKYTNKVHTVCMHKILGERKRYQSFITNSEEVLTEGKNVY